MNLEEMGTIEQIIESVDFDRTQREAIDEVDQDIEAETFSKDLSSRKEARKQLERNFVEKFNKAKQIMERIEEEYEDSSEFEKDAVEDGWAKYDYYKMKDEAYELLFEALINLIISYEIARDSRDKIKEQAMGMLKIHKKVRHIGEEFEGGVEDLRELTGKLEKVNEQTAKKEDTDQIKDKLENVETRISNQISSGGNSEKGQEKESSETLEKPYCPECGRDFNDNAGLAAHFRQKHPDSDKNLDEYKQ